MRWDAKRARRLTRRVDRVLLRAHRTKKPRLPSAFFARMEILIAEKRAAYESRNMERYEAALEAIAASAQYHLAARKGKNRFLEKGSNV
jgi:hypothetical protein